MLIKRLLLITLISTLAVMSAADLSGITQDKTPTGVAVFQKGENGVHTYRIPAITRTRSGVLLAFAEARHNSGSDTGDIDLVVKRSVDGGKTCGEMITIWAAGIAICVEAVIFMIFSKDRLRYKN